MAQTFCGICRQVKNGVKLLLLEQSVHQRMVRNRPTDKAGLWRNIGFKTSAQIIHHDNVMVSEKQCISDM
jgi:hypothetical protein